MDAEDMEALSSLIPDEIDTKDLIEENWKNGIHIDKTGKVHFIKEMTTSHLENTIKHFERFYTLPLEFELLKRKVNKLNK